MIRGRLTQTIVFICSITTLLEYLEIFNEKEIKMTSQINNSLFLRFIINPLYPGKMTTLTFITLYFIASSFSRVERHIFANRKDTFIICIIFNFLLTNFITFFFEIEFGIKFFILGIIHVSKSISPFSVYNLFIMKLNYKFTYTLVVGHILLQDFADNLIPLMICILANNLFYFLDQIPRLMSFTFLKRKDRVERVIKKREGYEDQIDVDWLNDEYLDQVASSFLSGDLEGSDSKGLEDGQFRDIHWSQMFADWKKHNDNIYLKIEKRHITTYSEQANKIEKYGIKSRRISTFLRRFVF